jgi:hypothetical protein
MIPDDDQPLVPDEDRPMHIYMPGMTRFGKTNLLFWMAFHDIARGKGVCVMDGKGGLIKLLLDAIPPYRKHDTILLDLTMPVPLDFIGYRVDDYLEKEAVIGELEYLLLKTAETSHLPTLSANLEDLLLTLFNYNENPKTPDKCRATFLDIHYFLTDEVRREQIKGRVTDQDLLRRWEKRWPPDGDIARLLTRINPFVRSETLKKIFGAKKPELNIEHEMNKGSVILVNLAPMNKIQNIYGTLLLSKIRQAAMRRDPDGDNVPFYLYCDEFHKFQTSDFADMLSMAGGLGLCLCLAHQYLAQLDPAIIHAIRNNCSTLCLFRQSEDAPAYRSQIRPMETELVHKRNPRTDEMEWVERPIPFDPDLLTDIPQGKMLLKPVNGPPRFIPTPPPPRVTYASSAKYIRNRTKNTYGCNTPQKCPTTADGNDTPRTEDINASGKANVPPHGGQKKKPPNSH